MDRIERTRLVAEAKRLAGYGESDKLSHKAVLEIARAMKALQEASH
jgi:hypothetical protein